MRAGCLKFCINHVNNQTGLHIARQLLDCSNLDLAKFPPSNLHAY